MSRRPHNSDGNPVWPTYHQGGARDHPQFVYYPVPQEHNARAHVPDDESPEANGECTCSQCCQCYTTPNRGSPSGRPAFRTAVPEPAPSPKCRSQRRHERSYSTNRHHEACDCPSCRARQTAIEMERLKEERRREREYRETRDFIDMMSRVEKKEREARMEEDYRRAMLADEAAEREARRYRRRRREEAEAENDFTFPAYDPTELEEIIYLEPAFPANGHQDYIHQLEAENATLRHQKEHLKGKVSRERAFRNKDEATKFYLANRLRDLDQDVQELQKRVRSVSEKTPNHTCVEIQVPHEIATNKNATTTSKDKEKGPQSADNCARHVQPHICYDSNCVDYDSCSDCDFRCDVRGCRKCRPKGGRSR